MVYRPRQILSTTTILVCTCVIKLEQQQDVLTRQRMTVCLFFVLFCFFCWNQNNFFLTFLVSRGMNNEAKPNLGSKTKKKHFSMFIDVPPSCLRVLPAKLSRMPHVFQILFLCFVKIRKTERRKINQCKGKEEKYNIFFWSHDCRRQ